MRCCRLREFVSVASREVYQPRMLRRRLLRGAPCAAHYISRDNLRRAIARVANVTFAVRYAGWRVAATVVRIARI